MKPAVAVVGSLNMDFVVGVERLPAPGETVLGSGFRMIPGGKGANQACAAAMAAGGQIDVRMIGRTGADVFAAQLKQSLTAAGVDVSGVLASQANATGIAMIGVERGGQNSIIVAGGANQDLRPGDAEGHRAAFSGARYALLQLETPLNAVAAFLRVAASEGALSILDPAPAQPLPLEICQGADILTPNESEALLLLGHEPRRVELADAPALSRQLRERGARAVVLKMGDRGCYVSKPGLEQQFSAFPVTAVDTTAAGDTFNAGLAVALAGGMEWPGAIRFASAAAAISVTRLGAQASAPSRAEILTFLR